MKVFPNLPYYKLTVTVVLDGSLTKGCNTKWYYKLRVVFCQRYKFRIKSKKWPKIKTKNQECNVLFTLNLTNWVYRKRRRSDMGFVSLQRRCSKQILKAHIRAFKHANFRRTYKIAYIFILKKNYDQTIYIITIIMLVESS